MVPTWVGISTLVLRPSITTNVVEGLVKLLQRMTSGGCLEAWLIAPCTCTSTAVHRKCHASKHPPDIILRRSFTRPSTVLAVIEGLGIRLRSQMVAHTKHTAADLPLDREKAPSWTLVAVSSVFSTGITLRQVKLVHIHLLLVEYQRLCTYIRTWGYGGIFCHQSFGSVQYGPSTWCLDYRVVCKGIQIHDTVVYKVRAKINPPDKAL